MNKPTTPSEPEAPVSEVVSEAEAGTSTAPAPVPKHQDPDSWYSHWMFLRKHKTAPEVIQRYKAMRDDNRTFKAQEIVLKLQLSRATNQVKEIKGKATRKMTRYPSANKKVLQLIPRARTRSQLPSRRPY